MVLRRLHDFSRPDRSSEAGYTLTETLVALAIFVTVLIPLATTIGNLLFSSSSVLARYALDMAQEKMESTVANGEFTESVIELEHDLRLLRLVEVRGELILVEIRVVRTRIPDVALVVLRRTIRK